MAKAASAVGSILPDGFDIRFNPDCYCPTVKHVETEDLQKQRHFVAEAAEFLLVQVSWFLCRRSQVSYCSLGSCLLLDKNIFILT